MHQLSDQSAKRSKCLESHYTTAVFGFWQSQTFQGRFLYACKSQTLVTKYLGHLVKLYLACDKYTGCPVECLNHLHSYLNLCRLVFLWRTPDQVIIMGEFTEHPTSYHMVSTKDTEMKWYQPFVSTELTSGCQRTPEGVHTQAFQIEHVCKPTTHTSTGVSHL